MIRLSIIILGFILFCSFNEPEEIKNLKERVDSLENTLFYLKFLGIPALGFTTIWALFLYLKGIKTKVNEIIEKDADKKLEAKAKELVAAKLSEYPFIQKYENELLQKKNAKIIVFGREKKDGELVKLLENKYKFGTVVSEKIENYESADSNKFNIVLFNNSKGELNQPEMDLVIEQFKNQADFCYLSGIGVDTFNSTINNFGKIAYANTRSTLEHNLLKLLS